MQHDASPSMPTLAQFVGEAGLAQGEYPTKCDFDLSLVNQLSDCPQAFAGGTATREKQRTYAKLVRFLLRWHSRCGNKRTTTPDHLPRAFESLSTHRVHHEIHVMDDLLNRCGGVINHCFCTQGAYKVYIGCPGRPDHLCSLPPGKLDRKRADATSGPRIRTR